MGNERYPRKRARSKGPGKVGSYPVAVVPRHGNGFGQHTLILVGFDFIPHRITVLSKAFYLVYHAGPEAARKTRNSDEEGSGDLAEGGLIFHVKAAKIGVDGM
jgi:hypothetical protein